MYRFFLAVAVATSAVVTSSVLWVLAQAGLGFIVGAVVLTFFAICACVVGGQADGRSEQLNKRK